MLPTTQFPLAYLKEICREKQKEAKTQVARSRRGAEVKTFAPRRSLCSLSYLSYTSRRASNLDNLGPS